MQSHVLARARWGPGGGYNDQIRGTSDVPPRIQYDALHISQPVSAQSRYKNKYPSRMDQFQYPALIVSIHRQLFVLYCKLIDEQVSGWTGEENLKSLKEKISFFFLLNNYSL